ncbi:MAG TPA: YceI family protein [Bryobacteraceae bacterium]|nr:YceI family protein [Bryobacteraceae bacterium]
MKIFYTLIPLLAGAAMLAPAATLAGQGSEFEFDPAQTKVEFTLGDVLHTVHGTFALKRGDLRFDENTGRAAGELVVDAGSGNSGSHARDSRMNKNVLESGKYQEIVFRPDRVIGTIAPQGASQVQLHGVFTIHGADHELTLPVEVRSGAGQYTATAHFSVPYVEWGMKNPSNFLLHVSPAVDITVRTVAHPVQPASAPALPATLAPAP